MDPARLVLTTATNYNNTMNAPGPAITTFVVWHHVVVVDLDMLDLPRSLGVTLHLNFVPRESIYDGA
jgi:hypothetical protein